MNITGIIAEYNPFHNGHAYQLARARALTGADYIIVVMSGDYVQRGTPAILEKHLRARLALENGADLVLELPVRYSTASAMDFASGSVYILDALNAVTHLCFGSESGDLDLLATAAEILEQEPEEYRTTLQTFLKQGTSYPAARQKAFESCLTSRRSDLPDGLLKSPNNILAIEYLRALLRLKSPIQPVTVTRTSDNYHSGILEHTYASATAVRRAMMENSLHTAAGYVPENVFAALDEAVRSNSLLTEDDFSLPLKYQLLQSTPETLTGCLDVPESLANRIHRRLNDYTGFSQFAELLKTRETTRTRINRSLLHILLQLDRTPRSIEYLRILGFRKSSAPLLTHLKQHTSLPLVTSLKKMPSSAAREDLFASNLYHSALACKTQVPQPEERSVPVEII